jgi:hypothetical protein
MVTIVNGCTSHHMVMVEAQPKSQSLVWCPMCGQRPN